MKCSAWGMYPRIECERFSWYSEEELAERVSSRNGLIPFGNGRSYGDSALSEQIIEIRQRDCFLEFGEASGRLRVQAGVLLAEIIEVFVPRGWFLKITPGTKLTTVGGAIASDVHGKNHHIEGCFSECVEEFRIMLPDGRVELCSREQTPELFRATCGGMGLTGIILEATIRLKRINSRFIDQTTIKTTGLEETFAAFEEYREQPYSVAWIDCLANREELGRCLLMTGDFCDDGELDYRPRTQKTIPCNFPAWSLNRWSVKAFNRLYYGRVKESLTRQRVDLESFFYPLDAIGHWNRIYGRNGFTQYQFILPRESSFAGLKEILTAIAASGRGSFLAVLKLYGPANRNWLSFPLEGYSLALDFKIDKGLFAFLEHLDGIVLKYGGRIYLTKDVRVSRATFEQGYPAIAEFRQFRKDHGMEQKFQSLQSLRVGI